MQPTLFAKGNQKTVGKLERLRKDAHAERAPKVALRIQGVLLSLEQHNVTEIAKLLHVHRDTVRCWVLAWNAQLLCSLWAASPRIRHFPFSFKQLKIAAGRRVKWEKAAGNTARRRRPPS